MALPQWHRVVWVLRDSSLNLESKRFYISVLSCLQTDVKWASAGKKGLPRIKKKLILFNKKNKVKKKKICMNELHCLPPTSSCVLSFIVSFFSLFPI
ncbi:hypothetical protein QVD17_07814 [Tagetes erecta]|uniref:Uncharacterized protein n=1 Tax=Tagetes erecta TaxID=13708 RepID=A0AAD8P488_TARER|nr:hypothetical protein QVD17_07814 [Tagetes erecta]